MKNAPIALLGTTAALAMALCACPSLTGGSCDPPFLKFAEARAIAVSDDAHYAFIAARWGYRKNSCASAGPFAGAVHVVNLVGGGVTTVELPAEPGDAAMGSDGFFVIPDSFQFSGAPVPHSYFRVDLTGTHALTTSSLADAPAHVAAAGGGRFLRDQRSPSRA